jgi:hypothetical protein
MLRKLLLVSLAFVTGCASSGSADFSSDAGSAEEVEMIIRNQTQEVVTAFAWWESGARVRLGDVRPRSTRTFTTSLRSQGVMLSLNVGEGRGSRRPVRPETYVDITAGDRWEWTINALASATRSENDVTYRRISGAN